MRDRRLVLGRYPDIPGAVEVVPAGLAVVPEPSVPVQEALTPADAEPALTPDIEARARRRRQRAPPTV